MKHYPCEKCGTRHRPTRHHVLPKCFFGGAGEISDLCAYCHREIEWIILRKEYAVSGTNSRIKLHENEYRRILRDFLDDSSRD